MISCSCFQLYKNSQMLGCIDSDLNSFPSTGCLGIWHATTNSQMGESSI